MIVAGGVYREVCNAARWDRIFGSGGRAALTGLEWGGPVRLVGYAGSGWIDDAVESFGGQGLEPELTSIGDDIAFYYMHPLAVPHIQPADPIKQSPLRVDGEHVLRFGFVEGDAVVKAKMAVCDPQGAIRSGGFRANGSVAEGLAVVLNEGEATAVTGKLDPAEAGPNLLQEADVVVIKRGTAGAMVFSRRHQPITVPPYRSQRVFKIGSGDVFSSTFAHLWMRERADPGEAADLASRAVAVYAETRNPPRGGRELLRDRIPLPMGTEPGRIYIAAPFFTTAQLWLVEELVAVLEGLGASVFSPFHDVGVGGLSANIASSDLRGLDGCAAVIAVLDGGDPGTLFEIGYAIKSGIPVVVLAENVLGGDLTMFEGSGCTVAGDIPTAAYHAVWATLS
jgi:nucleoside 2-deoxyribosyltransferase